MDTQGKVAQAYDDASATQDNTITLSTGVVLRAKPAPPLMLIQIMGHFPRPSPPVYFNKTMGRQMENPDDPDYKARVRAWETEQGNAVVNALIVAGTELVSVPPGMPGPDTEEWLEEFRLFGMPVQAGNKSWRYLRWMTFKAAVSSEDLRRIQEVVGRLSGIPEPVARAAEQFPGGQ